MGIMIAMSLVPYSYAWQFGGFEKGDVYEYYICDMHTRNEATSENNMCYDLRLYVIDIFSIDGDMAWVVHASMSDENSSIDDIIVVDKSYLKIKSFHNTYLEQSLENTLFWLSLHDVDHIELVVGETVYDVPGTFDSVVVTDFSREDGFTEYVLQSEKIFISIHDNIQLPVFMDVDTATSKFIMQLNSSYNELQLVDPVMEDPVQEDSLGDEPVMEDPVQEDSLGDDPVGDDPVGDDPVGDDPVGDDPVRDDPVGDDPVRDDPVRDDPVRDDPVRDDPVGDDPVGDDPVGDDPVGDDPVGDDPVGDDPVRDDPVRDDPVRDDPVREDSLGDDPVMEDPVMEDSNDLLGFISRSITSFFDFILTSR